MDKKPIYVWVEVTGSPLIRANKGKYVAFAGYNGESYNSCVYFIHHKGYEELIRHFGPFNTMDLACSAAEQYITGQLVFESPVLEAQIA